MSKNWERDYKRETLKLIPKALICFRNLHEGVLAAGDGGRWVGTAGERVGIFGSAGLGGVTSVGLTFRDTRNGGAVAGVGDGSLTAAGCALPD